MPTQSVSFIFNNMHFIKINSNLTWHIWVMEFWSYKRSIYFETSPPLIILTPSNSHTPTYYLCHAHSLTPSYSLSLSRSICSTVLSTLTVSLSTNLSLTIYDSLSIYFHLTTSLNNPNYRSRCLSTTHCMITHLPHTATRYHFISRSLYHASLLLILSALAHTLSFCTSITQSLTITFSPSIYHSLNDPLTQTLSITSFKFIINSSFK